MTLRSCFLVSFIQFGSGVSEEKSKMFPPIRGLGGNLDFLFGPEKHKLGRGPWDLASCQVSLNSVQRFRGEVENISANQRPGRPSWFSVRPEKHKIGSGRFDLASCKVSLSSVQRFQRRSRKCEKLTTDGQTDGRTTDDGQRVITVVHLSLRRRFT